MCISIQTNKYYGQRLLYPLLIQTFQDTNINTNVKNEEVKSNHNFVTCKKVLQEGKKRHSLKVEQKTSKPFIIN